jgi:pilus assembly protein CpaB
MRGRLLILVGLIILVVVVVVVFLLNGTGTPPPVNPDTGVVVPTVGPEVPTATPIPFVRIVIALQNLPRGYRFPSKIEDLANVVDYFPWPESAVPFNALREDQGGLEKVLGQVARTDIFREQPLLSTLLVPDLVSIANVGSDAAAVLPNDRVAVTIPINRVTSVGYGIQDGDHVDLIISMLFVDVDEVFQSIQPNNITLFSIKADGTIEFVEAVQGRPDVTSLGPAIIGPSERQRPRLVTQRTIQDALVLHVGDFPLSGDYIGVPPTPTPIPQDTTSDTGGDGGTPPPPPTPVPPPDIVTLGVTPQYSVVLVWAIEAKLPLTLALRSATDTSRVPTQPVTLDFIMNEFRIDLPGRHDYTIEPAIRSIRQLLAGDEISLNPTTP